MSRARRSRRARFVIVATDDPRIAAAVRSFGGDVVMTRADHPSGTDRVIEVAADLDVDIIVNVQGDEPEIDPIALDRLPTLLTADAAAQVATLAVPIQNIDEWHDPNCVKVVCDDQGRALYFSRSPIPHLREGTPDFGMRPPRFLRHLGVYAFRRDYLLQLAKIPIAKLEEIERLEQLRWLAAGGRIAVSIVSHRGIGVDTLDHYRQFVRRYRAKWRRPTHRAA